MDARSSITVVRLKERQFLIPTTVLRRCCPALRPHLPETDATVTHLELSGMPEATFETLVYYFRTGRLPELSVQNVIDVYCAASDLGIRPLKQNCWNHVFGGLTEAERALLLLAESEKNKKMSNTETARLMDIIVKKFRKVVNSAAFLQLTEKQLCTLLTYPPLRQQYDSNIIYKASMRWLHADCRARQGYAGKLTEALSLSPEEAFLQTLAICPTIAQKLSGVDPTKRERPNCLESGTACQQPVALENIQGSGEQKEAKCTLVGGMVKTSQVNRSNVPTCDLDGYSKNSGQSKNNQGENEALFRKRNACQLGVASWCLSGAEGEELLNKWFHGEARNGSTCFNKPQQKNSSLGVRTLEIYGDEMQGMARGKKRFSSGTFEIQSAGDASQVLTKPRNADNLSVNDHCGHEPFSNETGRLARMPPDAPKSLKTSPGRQGNNRFQKQQNDLAKIFIQQPQTKESSSMKNKPPAPDCLRPSTVVVEDDSTESVGLKVDLMQRLPEKGLQDQRSKYAKKTAAKTKDRTRRRRRSEPVVDNKCNRRKNAPLSMTETESPLSCDMRLPASSFPKKPNKRRRCVRSRAKRPKSLTRSQRKRRSRLQPRKRCIVS